MKEKITLISLYPELKDSTLRVISGYLKDRNIDTQIIYLPQQFYEEYDKEDIKNLIELCKDSDIVGITLISHFKDKAIIITKKIKEKLNCEVIWGGVHPFSDPEECLKYADEICVGDGEIFLTTGENKRLENIDIIPDFDFSNQYILKNKKIIKLNEKLFAEYSGSYFTFLSRGCPNRCSYCINSTLKPKLRVRSIKNVIEELLYVKKNLPSFKKIVFMDEVILALKTTYLRIFFKQYKEKINLPFVIGGVHPSFVTEEKVKILLDAGVKETRLGIETGNDKIRKLYNRNENNFDVINSVNILKKFNIKLTLDFITDNPYETKEDIIETLKLIRILSPFEINLHSLILYKGTKLYEIAKRDNLLFERDYINTVKPNYLNSLYLFLSRHKVSEKTLSYLLKTKLSFFFKHLFFIEYKLFKYSESFDFHMLFNPYYYKRGLDLWKKNYVR